METLYKFRFNSDFTLQEDEWGRFFIVRDKLGDETNFDIESGYKGDKPNTFISNANKYQIESEIRDADVELYSQVYGLPTPSEGGGQPAFDMDEVIQKVMKSNLELIKEVKGNNPYEEAIIEGIISKGEKITEETIMEGVREKIDEFIKTEYGSLPQRLEIVTPKSRKVMEGLFHKQFNNILNLVDADVPVLLVGPAGSGKNHTLEQVAESLDLEFYFSNAVTQEHKITGFTDANGFYHETQFFKAFKNGGLFFLDEMDASIPEVLLILNSAIANRYFDFPKGRVEAHEDFRIVAAANTFGNGADNMYVGRSQLDAATLDRFAVLDFDYDENVESQLAVSPELFDFIKESRRVIDENGIRYVLSMRATINASKLDEILELNTLMTSIIFKGLERSDIEMIDRNLRGLPNNKYVEALSEMLH